MNRPLQALAGMIPSGGAVWAIHEPSAAALLSQWQTMPVGAYVVAEGSGRSEHDEYPGVALVSIEGPMSREGMPCFGGGSTVDARREIRAAAKDPNVKSIVLLLNSPGGTVAGTGDLGDEIAAADLVKPVYGYIPDQCCSAAYWAGSQCRELWASRNAQDIGNIGTRASITDVSEALARAGVKVTILSTGPYKAAGDGSVPISEDHMTYLQGYVDTLNEGFKSAVASGRKVSAEKVDEWADGRWHTASQALALGLIDAVGTLDDLINKISLPATAQVSAYPSPLRATYAGPLRSGS